MSCFSFLSFLSFSSTKSEYRRVEQVLPRSREDWYQQEGGDGGERGLEGV
jgi:hypothetical protein